MQSHGGGGGGEGRPGEQGGGAAGDGGGGGASSGVVKDRTRSRMLRSGLAACTCARFARCFGKENKGKYLLLGMSSRSGYWSGSEE